MGAVMISSPARVTGLQQPVPTNELALSSHRTSLRGPALSRTPDLTRSQYTSRAQRMRPIVLRKVASREEATTREQEGADYRPILPFLGILAATGAVCGPPLDGIHSRVQLLIYDRNPIDLGGLHSSAWVVLLLAVFYAVLGALHPLLDTAVGDKADRATAQVQGRLNPGYVALSVGLLAALLQLSSIMYSAEIPYNHIHAVLATLALVNWKVFDGTRQGFALALLCGTSALAAEIAIMYLFGLWHYTRPDLLPAKPFGLTSWTFWCYFFYTPALGNYARLLWRNHRMHP